MGCKLFDSPISPDDGDGQDQIETGLRLGEKEENPYSLAYLQQAHDALVDRGEIVPLGEVLAPNYLYVCFKPETEEHMELLGSFEDPVHGSLELFDHPLDYELLGEGDFVENPLSGHVPFPWQYTAVPVESSLPDVPVSVLDELFMPDDEDEDPDEGEEVEGAVAPASSSYYSRLEDEAYVQAGYTKPQPAGRWNPQAEIKVWDDTRNVWMSVQGIRIRVRNFTKIRTGYTNSSGQWRCSTRYRGNVWYSARHRMKNDNMRVLRGRGNRRVKTSKTYYRGKKSGSTWRLSLRPDNSHWLDLIAYKYAFHIIVEDASHIDQLLVETSNGKSDRRSYTEIHIPRETVGLYREFNFQFEGEKNSASTVYGNLAFSIGVRRYISSVEKFSRFAYDWGEATVSQHNSYGYTGMPIAWVSFLGGSFLGEPRGGKYENEL
jgi:hypothetical protein